MRSNKVLKWFRLHFYASLISPDCHLSNKATGTLHEAGMLVGRRARELGERSAAWTEPGGETALFCTSTTQDVTNPSFTVLNARVSVFLCLFI